MSSQPAKLKNSAHTDPAAESMTMDPTYCKKSADTLKLQIADLGSKIDALDKELTDFSASCGDDLLEDENSPWNCHINDLLGKIDKLMRERRTCEGTLRLYGVPVKVRDDD